MMSAIIWVHEDALRDDHPVRAEVGDTARAVFIWDEAYLRRQEYSVKRLTFIMECLCDMDVEVFKGDMQVCLSELAVEARIYTAATPNPEFRAVIDALSITLISEIPLARIDEQADLGRFFRYWKKADKSVMGHNGFPGGQEELFS